MSEDILNEEVEVPTSEESELMAEENSKKLSFNLFDAMLGLSVVFVALAILLLVSNFESSGTFLSNSLGRHLKFSMADA